MLLGLSSAGRLRERYGSDYDTVRAAIDAAFAAMAGHRQAELIFADDAISMSTLGLTATTIQDSTQLRQCIRTIGKALTVDTLVLFGGNGVLPFCEIPNPVLDRRLDPDVSVQCDLPYGAAAAGVDDPLSEAAVPTARVPDPDPPSTRGFTDVLKAFGRAKPPRAPSTFAVINAEWEDLSARLLSGRVSLQLSPPWLGRDAGWRSERPRLIYFNLHGFQGLPTWRAFDDYTGRWFDAVMPSDADGPWSEGAVVFAENCYGAELSGRSRQNSIAMALLGAGASAFIGATGLAYGSLVRSSRPAGADVLASTFLREANSGVAVGAALQRARSELVRRAAGSMTRFDHKTALQFVLLGNPEAVI